MLIIITLQLGVCIYFVFSRNYDVWIYIEELDDEFYNIDTNCNLVTRNI